MASSCNESQLIAGNDGYSAAYETLQTIGKGAFGYVRLARRRADQQLVSALYLHGYWCYVKNVCISTGTILLQNNTHTHRLMASFPGQPG